MNNENRSQTSVAGGKRRIHLPEWLPAIICVLAVFPASPVQAQSPAPGTPRQQLKGHLTVAMASAPLAGRVPSDTQMILTIGLTIQNRAALLDFAERRDLPVLGVCRGMQMIQHRFGNQLQRVHGHVAPRQRISIEGRTVEVNSFHNFGATTVHPPLMTWAIADDGVIKAVKHTGRRITGVMWHPERLEPFAGDDVALFSRFFEV